MYVSNLIIEITRRCNMKCTHCLRGPAQRLDMHPGVMFKIFNQIDLIGSLTITGGEPSMKPELINRLLITAQQLGTSINSFNIVSNAHSTYKRKEFLEVLIRLREFCGTPEECLLEVSQDQYHMQEHTPDMKYYDNDEPFYSEYYGEYINVGSLGFVNLQGRKGYIEPKRVLKEGRAFDFGYRKKDPETWEASYGNDELFLGGGELYISADGSITNDCDMSYTSIKKKALGNILTDTLSDIVERNSIIEESDQAQAV